MRGTPIFANAATENLTGPTVYANPEGILGGEGRLGPVVAQPFNPHGTLRTDSVRPVFRTHNRR